MISDRIVRRGVIARNNISGKLWRIVDCYGRQICAKQAVLECGGLGATRHVNEDPSNYTWVAASIDEHQHNVKKERLKMKLYQIKDTDTFVTRLATNSEGLAVVEVKGTGMVQSVNPSLLIEVVPYTICAARVDGKGTAHFAAKEGAWSKDDVFALGGLLWVVSDLNTKMDGAKELKAKKMATVE